ncbi:unnamed protein product [Sphagnum balticum]
MIVSSILQRARYAWQRIAKVTAVKHGHALTVPDERFQRYNSPVPSRIDHTLILSTPELKLTTLPNGLRVATESNLSADSATVCVCGLMLEVALKLMRQMVLRTSSSI